MNIRCPLKQVFTLLLTSFFLTAPAAHSQAIPHHPGKAKIKRIAGVNDSRNITTGLQDRQGNLWFGTTGDGLYKYDGKLFTHYTMKDGLSGNHVWSMLEDRDGILWLGTNNGICRMVKNRIASVPVSFFIRPEMTDNRYYTEWSTRTTVWSIMQDKTGKIWFGTGEAVYYYSGGVFTRFLANSDIVNNDSLSLRMVSDILEDKKGIIWFASGMPPGFEGFCRYDGKKIERFRPKNEGWYRQVIESRNGNLLLATRRYGVWEYDGKTFSDYSQPKDLVKGSLNAILEDKAGNLWVASDYGKDPGDTLGGLWYSAPVPGNPAAKTFTRIFNKEVYFILEDKDNAIWFSTRSMGLYRFDRKKLTQYSE